MTTIDAREARTRPPEAAGGVVVADLMPGQFFRLAGEGSPRFFQATDQVEYMGRQLVPMVPCNGVGLDSSLRVRRCRVRGDREAVVLSGYTLLGAFSRVVDGYRPSPLLKEVGE